MIFKVKKAFKNPKKLFQFALQSQIGRIIPDELYLKLLFWLKLGYKLDLTNPKTFNEKLQWLKLNDRKPEHQRNVDKYEVKHYIEELLGEEFVIKTLGVWNSFDDIDFDTLPKQFVLKCTHDSGGVLVCKDKSKLDIDSARNTFNRRLKTNYYWEDREWPYKNIQPRIIAEEYMEAISDKELKDYKFFCCNGKVKFFKIDFDRFVNHRANYYSREGVLLPFGESDLPPDFSKELKIPDELEKMEGIAELLAEDELFVRIDLYDCNGKILFGEITYYPASGLGRFTIDEWDRKIGDMLELPI